MAGEPSSGTVFNTANAGAHDDRTPGMNSISDAWGYFQYFCKIMQGTTADNINGIASLAQRLI